MGGVHPSHTIIQSWVILAHVTLRVVTQDKLLLLLPALL